jgi:phosphoribosylformylglycinamidine synthase
LDVSEGGLVFALLEACLGGEVPLGVVVDVKRWENLRMDAVLFGESRGRALVSVREDAYLPVERMARVSGIPCFLLGKVRGKDFLVQSGGRVLVSLPVGELKRTWEQVLS